MEGEVLESGVEEGGRREGRRVSKRISELAGRFEEGGGSEDSENIVKLDAGYNTHYAEKQHFRKTFSSKDIFSSSKLSFLSRVVSKENETMSERANWLNKLTSNKLTANRKPGGEKRIVTVVTKVNYLQQRSSGGKFLFCDRSLIYPNIVNQRKAKYINIKQNTLFNTI